MHKESDLTTESLLHLNQNSLKKKVLYCNVNIKALKEYSYQGEGF